tara:strand:- start:21 stop:635 length:615 start_codon:yes stop_codon:yes gene_type:complete
MKAVKANKYQGLLDIPKMDAGGQTNPVHKGSRSVSRKKLKEIEERQIAPIEALLRRIAMRQELKEGESEGDAFSSESVDFGSGSEGESCREVDGKIVCGAYGYDQGDAADSAAGEDREKKPLSLVLADLIKEGRDVRQSSLKKRLKKVGKRRELDLDPSRSEQKLIRNPLARARYKSLQRRLARSEGREKAGEDGGYQVIKASF